MVLLNIIKLTKVYFFEYVRNEAMLVLVSYFFKMLVFFSLLGKTCFWTKVHFLTFPVTVMVLLNVGPMGPRVLGPNHFSTVSQMAFGGFFSGKKGVPKQRMRN